MVCFTYVHNICMSSVTTNMQRNFVKFLEIIHNTRRKWLLINMLIKTLRFLSYLSVISTNDLKQIAERRKNRWTFSKHFSFKELFDKIVFVLFYDYKRLLYCSSQTVFYDKFYSKFLVNSMLECKYFFAFPLVEKEKIFISFIIQS